MTRIEYIAQLECALLKANEGLGFYERHISANRPVTSNVAKTIIKEISTIIRSIRECNDHD